MRQHRHEWIGNRANDTLRHFRFAEIERRMHRSDDEIELRQNLIVEIERTVAQNIAFNSASSSIFGMVGAIDLNRPRALPDIFSAGESGESPLPVFVSTIGAGPSRYSFSVQPRLSARFRMTMLCSLLPVK